MSVEEAGAGETEERMWEWDIYIYFFYVLFYFIVILNVPSWVLSPCVKGKFGFLCFVYFWIIKIYLIWFVLIWYIEVADVQDGGRLSIGTLTANKR